MTYIYNNKEMTVREIKALNPNVSYKEPTQLGAVAVLPTPKPECSELQQAVRDGVTTDSLGNTVQAWKVVDMFNDYTNEEGVLVTKAEQEATYLAKKLQDTAKALENEVSNHIKSKCIELGYDDENSIAKYLVQGNPFYDECTAISLWIGNVWTTVHTIKNDVEAGTRELPTDIISELPIYGA